MKIMCNILQQYYCRVYTAHYTAIFIWWWIWVHISMWQSSPAITWLWLVHVVLIFICLTDRDSQCWKIKTVRSSIQWYDSDLHSYLTFSYECLNMSHGISSRYYMQGVILAWRCLSGVSYIDRSRVCAMFCNSITVECLICTAVIIWWWIGGHISMCQSLPAIAGLWLVHIIVMVICLTDQDSQCWKIKTVHTSIQWYDSDLHSYLTFSYECLNMSHGISSRYYVRVVILAWRCLSGVSYVDRWR